MLIPNTESKLIQEILPFLRPSAKRQVWLVGGFIRDLLNGKKECFDIDLALNFNPFKDAREYARSTNSGVVILDEERHIIRVVRNLENGQSYTFDLSEFRSDNIDGDLIARDFTINAIAAPLFDEGSDLIKNNEIRIYDPLNGVNALKEKRISICSDKVFIDDPLRIMRAFRFGALYDSNLSDQLLGKIEANSELLSNVSGERIRDELFKILSISDSYKWVKLLDKTGILKIILPELDACHGVTQNDWHHLDVFDHSILTLEKFESLINIPAPYDWWKTITEYLFETISGSRTYLQLFKFGSLVHDIGKVACKEVNAETGKITFYRHEVEGSKMMKSVSERFRLSSKEQILLQNITKNHMRPGTIIQQGITDKKLYRFFNEAGRDGLGICLVCLADRFSALGANVTENELVSFAAGIYQIMNEYFIQINQVKIKPLLNGREIMEKFKLEPGPIIRKLLIILEEAQFAGEIQNKEEAAIFLSKELSQLK